MINDSLMGKPHEKRKIGNHIFFFLNKSFAISGKKNRQNKNVKFTTEKRNPK